VTAGASGGSAVTVNDSLTSALSLALEPLVRRLVDDAVRRAELHWRWRTTEQAAELLGITPAAVTQRKNRGQLHGYKLDGGTRNFYDIHELDAALRDGHSESQLHRDQDMASALRQQPEARRPRR